jgi:beta-glucanase (GH16 family)
MQIMTRSLVRLAFAWYCSLFGEVPLVLCALPAQVSQYQLVFSDEFDTFDLGLSDDASSTKPHTWYEGVWFNQQHAPREDFVVANSALSLTWKRGQPQSDSSISTFSRRNAHYHAWRYGYFEVRMKWPPEGGAWPAVWLIPVQAAMQVGQPESGEMDIFEGQGNQPHTFFGTIHRWKGKQHLASSSGSNRFPLPPKTDFSEFHTYGFLWVPGRVTWYFDDLPLHSETTFDVFDRQDYCLILGMQEGSNWKEGNLTGVKAQSLTLTVDWVRVWQLHSN